MKSSDTAADEEEEDRAADVTVEGMSFVNKGLHGNSSHATLQTDCQTKLLPWII